MQEEKIRAMIRQKLMGHRLPLVKCQITWFGPGSRQTCAACETEIAPDQIECECEHPEGAVLRFHRECFAWWDEIRQVFA